VKYKRNILRLHCCLRAEVNNGAEEAIVPHLFKISQTLMKQEFSLLYSHNAQEIRQMTV
jgi:hypothetical protein